MSNDRRENDKPTHERLVAIETIMVRWDKALFGNGQVGFIKETQEDLAVLDKRVSKQAIYWKLAMKILAALAVSGGGVAAIARFAKWPE